MSICALLVCCCGCFASLRLCLVKILVGSKQLAWGVVLGEGRGWGMSPRRIVLLTSKRDMESSSAPFYDRKFDESTACRVQGRRATRLYERLAPCGCDDV